MKEKLGLVVTGGECPLFPVVLANPSDFLVVAADSGLHYVDQQKLPVQAVVGDMDSVDADMLEKYIRAGIIVQQYDTAKDYTDTEIALEYIWQYGITRTAIIGGSGGRLDHLLSILRLFEREKSPYRWITSNEEIYLIDSDFEIETSFGEILSFFPVGNREVRAESEGLRWQLNDLIWKHQDSGASNESTADYCRIRIISGKLLFVRQLPKSVGVYTIDAQSWNHASKIQ